jgi:hypothetical protein
MKVVCEWDAKRSSKRKGGKVLTRCEHNTSKEKEGLNTRAIPQGENELHQLEIQSIDGAGHMQPCIPTLAC